MNKASRVKDYLHHILEAIERISRYTENMTETDFLAREMVQDAVIRNLGIVGEASDKIQKASPQFVSKHKDVPWAVMYGMRNRLTHGYHAVDLEIVWKTVQSDLPVLQEKIDTIISGITRNHSDEGNVP